MQSGSAILSIFPQGKNTTNETEATNATVSAKQFIRRDSAKLKMQARCAAVVQGVGRQPRLPRRHLEASAHLAAELSPA